MLEHEWTALFFWSSKENWIARQSAYFCQYYKLDHIKPFNCKQNVKKVLSLQQQFVLYLKIWKKKKNLKNQKKERSNIYLREKKSLNEDLYSFYKEQRRSNKQPLLYHMDQNNIKIRAKDKIITLNKHKKINLRILQDVFIHYKYRIK